MGQTRNVLVYRLLCENTVDERITVLLQEKQAIFVAFADELPPGAAGEIDVKKEVGGKMKLTTGYDFQGYFITEYIDVFFDEVLFGIGFSRGIASSIDNIFSSLSGGEATAKPGFLSY